MALLLELVRFILRLNSPGRRTRTLAADRAADRPVRCRRDPLQRRPAGALRWHPSSDCGETQI